ncbi:hypothetical protein N657DRAFT_640900 [Parathielavia appendiculata]|uniref:Uncharacterized protein n=1 Tax=Parathielavia appendiculata TaxID=2587402 RepID=A0AAN6U678_9PEZI|nr:hypothetical protein N657DRAFT_640900 [Parathielavia appendiculata]
MQTSADYSSFGVPTTTGPNLPSIPSIGHFSPEALPSNHMLNLAPSPRIFQSFLPSAKVNAVPSWSLPSS